MKTTAAAKKSIPAKINGYPRAQVRAARSLLSDMLGGEDGAWEQVTLEMMGDWMCGGETAQETADLFIEQGMSGEMLVRMYVEEAT